MTVATAGGKVILFGEHAVVYGRPAIAVPVSGVRARAEVSVGPPGQGVRVVAPDLGLDFVLSAALAADDPLALILSLGLGRLGIDTPGDLTIVLSSELPVARGLGSGAAISTAVVRALAAHFGRELGPEAVSELVFETEKLYHGTPSGIDNTVIAFEQPVYFVKGRRPEIFPIHSPFRLIIADTGIQSSTRAVVGDVRRAWETDRARYDALFDEVGRIAGEGRICIESGAWPRMGALMDENHRLLQEIGVSSPELDALVWSARSAGARGAKLSGAGRGGNVIALVEDATCERTEAALRAAGAVGIIHSLVGEAGDGLDRSSRRVGE